MPDTKFDDLADDELIVTSTCAEYHDVSNQAVIDAIKRGDIDGRKLGAGYVMTKRACLNYKPAKTASERGARGKGRPKSARVVINHEEGVTEAGE